MAKHTPRRVFLPGGWALLVFALVAVAGHVKASETTERRIQIALSIFPRIVAVDTGLREKLSKDNVARLAFIYVAEKLVAEDLVAQITRSTSNVAGLPLDAMALTLDTQIQAESTAPTAIFIVERLSDSTFTQILRYASDHHILAFSPFSGDVERGAMVGISVTSRVRPYFNMQSLTEAGVAINPTLLKMSARYE